MNLRYSEIRTRGCIYISLIIIIIIIIKSLLEAPQSIMCHVLSYCCCPLDPIQRIWHPVSKARQLHICLSPFSSPVVILDVSVSTVNNFTVYCFKSHAQPRTWTERLSLLSETSPLTCATWKALPVTTLKSAWFSESFYDASPNIVPTKRYIRRELPNMWLPLVQN